MAKWPGPATAGNTAGLEQQVDHLLAKRAERPARLPAHVPAPFRRYDKGRWLAAVSPTADGWLLQILRHGKPVWSTTLDVEPVASPEMVLEAATATLALVGHNDVSDWRSAGWVVDIG
jgi:hypothetical protein